MYEKPVSTRLKTLKSEAKMLLEPLGKGIKIGQLMRGNSWLKKKKSGMIVS